MLELVDRYRRKFVYLRLSVTDRCNFRCVYCLPNGYQGSERPESELSIDEMRRLVTGFSSLGVFKVRLTGGEPTVRRDIVEIAKTISKVPGIRKLGITTNGNRLAELARPLFDAGVTSVNVSIDSLDQEKFREITGIDRLTHILKGVEQALSLGFESVKVNAVLLKDCNESELFRFLAWIKDRPVSVRFIELMRTGKNGDFFHKRHLSGGLIQLELLKAGFSPAQRELGNGPAVVYRHPEYRGSIGIIAPYSPEFCKSCNRLRVSSRGALRLCLFGEKDQSLREYLIHDSQQNDLTCRIQSLLTEKPATHFLQEGRYGNTWNLAGIGG